MIDQDLLFKETNRDTAAIMQLLENYLTDGEDLKIVRKQVGDILHDSRRRLQELFGDEGLRRCEGASTAPAISR